MTVDFVSVLLQSFDDDCSGGSVSRNVFDVYRFVSVFQNWIEAPTSVGLTALSAEHRN